MASVTPTAADAVRPGGPWLTSDIREIDTLALELLDHPVIISARAEALERYKACDEYQVADAPRCADAAVDGLLFNCLQWAAAADPARPKVGWSVRLPYSIDGVTIPDSHYGADSPDRVYRFIGASGEHHYEISGRRHRTHPSEDDLSLEALPAPGLFGQPMVRLNREEIDIDADGRFAVTADGTPAEGRRNHLYLPDGTRSIVVRDTLLDWAHQVPNQVSVTRVEGPDTPAWSIDEYAAEGREIFEGSVKMMLGFLTHSLRGQPVNALRPFLRPVKWGMAGSLFAVNRFELNADEALVFTMVPLGATYIAVAACDPWTTSIAYDRRVACLNGSQAQANRDGSYTFALGPSDPGIHNWLDTGGLQTGSFVARWEGFSEPPPIEDDGRSEDEPAWAPGVRVVQGAASDVRVLNIADVAASIPEGQESVDPARRQQLRAERKAAYQVRVTGQIATGA